ncbi:MAG: ABC transporter permease [Dehalococcoidia bacterium]|nr:MAG: ABC transporter permease [Dehalococcoidia bacterium]
MKFIDSFVMALRSLMANKMRSSLTMLGVVIGVGAVITLMAVGTGVQEMVTSSFEELGTDVIYVQPSNPEAPGMAAMAPGYAEVNLTLDDANAVADLPTVVGIAPTNENFVEITTADEKYTAVIHGSTPQYLDTYKFEVGSGQFLTDVNVARRDMVVVIGSKVAEELFGDDDPIGQQVKIKEKRFTVIGVLEPRGVAFLGFSWDDLVVTPITTYQTRLFSQRTAGGEDAIQSIAVQMASAEDVDRTTADIEKLLRKRHKIDADEKDDFSVVTLEQMLAIFGQITLVLTLLLGTIASISLVVGGIGIMNIMLVSVTERTKEIGLRKAVGAKRRDILLQFLIEAAMLSLVGGAIGLTGGWLLAEGISLIDLGGFKLHAAVSPLIVILAVSVSAFIGIASGLYPAVRASRLDPIEALRYG